MSFRRMSLGANASLVLQDASSKSNSRQSVTGGLSETPMKDRRAKLEVWRRNALADRHKTAYGPPFNAEYGNAESFAPPMKRARTDLPPQLPPAFSASTAVERLRKKRLDIQQIKADQSFDNSFEDNDDDMSSYFSASSKLLLSATPSSNTKRLGAARRRSVCVARVNNFSQSSELTLSQHSPEKSEQVMGEQQAHHNLDSVEEADLRSRVREMQQRIDQLEKEKVMLSIDKAPLEARFRQRENEWIKGEKRMMQEIDQLKKANRIAHEGNRDAQHKIEALDEENRQMRLEIRKASSALNDSTTYTRQQADRAVLELKKELLHADDEINSMRLANMSIEKELHATKIEFESLERDYADLRVEYDEISSSTSHSQEAEIKLEHLTTEHIATTAQLNAVCADLAATKARAEAALQALHERYKNEFEQLQFEMSVIRARSAEATRYAAVHGGNEVDENDVPILKARIEERERRIVELQAQVLRGEEQRRQMHNQIQELRGNIRVFVRTRPFLPNDGQSASTPAAIDVSPDEESLSITDTRSNSEHEFKFDKVFGPSSGQDVVFDEVSDFVQSALDGFHVCLFSYGQTGSGKTHTMQGSGNGVMRGIIPRAVEKILQQAEALSGQKWDFNISASFLEIYNENLNDLLYSMSGGDTKNPPKLAIKRSREGKSFVEGATEISIDTKDSSQGLQQLNNLMNVAARARSVASTKMNSQSSRSHSIFMLTLRGWNSETGTTVQGALNLCDLAGSERLDRSGAGSDAQRLKETQAINKSLSSLGDVFTALSQGASHVPYRNSKLTYLLQDCLSGDGKALMFVNLSPSMASSNESLCSLRFAQRVNQVELGKPTKHIQYSKGKR